MINVDKLPEVVKTFYNEVYNQAVGLGHDSLKASSISWAITKGKLNKVENSYIARCKDFEIIKKVHYEFVADEASVSRSDDGYSYVDYVLLTNGVHNDGIRFSNDAVNSLVDQINNEGLVGRVEALHEEWEQLVRNGLSPEEVEKILQGKDTGIKAIKAVNNGGKVVARVKVRQDLVDKVLSYKGASVEARIPAHYFKDGFVTNARYQGFVFTPSPADPNALRVGMNG